MNSVPDDEFGESSQPETVEATTPTKYRVQGKCLVVRNGAVMPQFCIKTNVAVSPTEMETRHLTWIPTESSWFLLLGNLPFLAAYFMSKESVTITFGLSDRARHDLRNLRFAAMGASALTVISFLAFAIAPSPISYGMAIALFIGAAVFWAKAVELVQIKKHLGGEFWIVGCSKPFLSRIVDSQPFTFGFDQIQGGPLVSECPD